MLELSRAQIVAQRLRANGLGRRLPFHATSLRKAAWAGLQDSSPRAALLSLHARVDGIQPDSWEHKSLVQLWGPRYNDYVVASKDLAVFSLGRLPQDVRGRARAYDTAASLHAFLDGRRMPFHDNSLRYAATTGTVVLRWDGAHRPVVWTVPAPEMDPGEARAELARRFLRVFGPSTEVAFSKWAGIGRATFDGIEKIAVNNGAWILASDEAAFREPIEPATGVRLLPSGDAFYLLWGADRELLVPDAQSRAELWTTRVWPGALLLDGEIAGTWSRPRTGISVHPWRKLTSCERESIEAEIASLPLY